MKLTDKQRKYIRFGLWTAGLCWALFFFTYSMVLLPSILEMVGRFAAHSFSVWIFGVFYVLVVVTGVVIFFWFFNYLMRRKK